MALYLSILCILRPIGILIGLVVVQAPGFVALVVAAFLQVILRISFKKANSYYRKSAQELSLTNDFMTFHIFALFSAVIQKFKFCTILFLLHFY